MVTGVCILLGWNCSTLYFSSFLIVLCNSKSWDRAVWLWSAPRTRDYLRFSRENIAEWLLSSQYRLLLRRIRHRLTTRASSAFLFLPVRGVFPLSFLGVLNISVTLLCLVSNG